MGMRVKPGVDLRAEIKTRFRDRPKGPLLMSELANLVGRSEAHVTSVIAGSRSCDPEVAELIVAHLGRPWLTRDQVFERV